MALCLHAIASCEEKRIVGPTLSELIASGMDPRISRIVPDSIAGRALPPPVVREVPDPTAPREVRLNHGTATVYPNIRMHPDSTTTQSEMSIATHPLNPNVVLAGANSFDSSVFVLSQGWYSTIDGGATWDGGDTLPAHSDLSLYMSDPAVGIDLDGNLFFNTLLYRRGATISVVIARSSDQGATWAQAAVPNPSGGEDKNHLAVDVNPGSPFKDYLYTAFTDFNTLLTPYPAKFSRSTDGGTTLTTPIPISGSIGSYMAQGVNLAVGPNGDLYGCWSGYDSWPPPVRTWLGFNKSTDGASWGVAQSIRSIADIRGYLAKGGNSIRVNSFPSMAVDRSNGPRRGWIYIVYSAWVLGTPDIFLVRSTDQGATWSDPLKVNQDSSGKDQWFPWISVDPITGHLYVVYYDSRNFPANDSAQVFVSSSWDGGDTFEDVLVSDAAFLPAPIPGVARGYSGDYIGISAMNGVVWPSWNDNRTGIHQAYTSRIVFVEVGSPPRIGISPDTLNYGQVFLGHPETLSVFIHNLAFPETLSVSSILSDHPEFVPDIASFALPGGSARRLRVAFNPSAVGPIEAALTIASNDLANPSVTVALRATVVYPPALSVRPDSFAFNLNKGDSAAALETIGNTGLGTLSFSAQVQAFGSGATSSSYLTNRLEPLFETNDHRNENRLPFGFGARGRDPDLAPLRSASGGEVGSRILLLAADDDVAVSDARSKLYATGRFSSIDFMNVSYPLGSSPTLAQLQSYDAVLVWSNHDFFDPVSLGDVLADYVDGGGGVVTAFFSFARLPDLPNRLIQGRFDSQNYWAIQPGDEGLPSEAGLGTIYVPGHATVQNVNTFDGGLGSYRLKKGVVSTGAILIASWSDGEPLVAVKTIAGTKRVDLGFYPPSSDAALGNWLSTTDGAVLIANALEYVAVPAFVAVTPALGSVLPGDSANIEVEVRTARLDPGNFRNYILISSNDPTHPVDTIPVNVTVNCAAVRGDLNGDTLLTTVDVVHELNCAFLNEGSGTVGGDCNLCYSDGNCDGNLSPADVVLELLAVFMKQPFPC